MRNRRLLGVTITGLLAIQTVVAVTASAQATKRPSAPITIWNVNGVSGLYALGSFVAFPSVPTPVAGQAAENKWAFTHAFGFTNNASAFGVVSLDTQGTERLGTIQLNNGTSVTEIERFAFNWVPNKFYFPAVTFLPGNVLAAFVMDVETQAWTYIGTVRVPPAWGLLSPRSATSLQWYGEAQNDCAAFPLADYYRSAPYGWVIGEANPRLSAAVSASGVAADCPASVANEPSPPEFWRHYRAGSATGPVATTSSTTASSTTSSSTTTSSTTTSSTTTTTTGGLLGGLLS